MSKLTISALIQELESHSLDDYKEYQEGIRRRYHSALNDNATYDLKLRLSHNLFIAVSLSDIRREMIYLEDELED